MILLDFVLSLYFGHCCAVAWLSSNHGVFAGMFGIGGGIVKGKGVVLM